MGRCRRRRRRKKKKEDISNRDFNLSDDPKVIELMKWLKENGWREEVGLRLCSFPDTGRGLKSLGSVEAGSVVVSIPRSLLITRDVVLRSPLATILAASRLDPSRLSSQTLIALFLLHEKSQPEQQSFWHPYLQTLPAGYHVPFFCDDDVVEDFPKYLRDVVVESREKVEAIFKHLQCVLLDVFPIDVASFAWAWFTVNTRSVYLRDDSASSHENCLALAPYLDMFNHSFEARVTVGVDLRKRCDRVYQIVTDTGVQRSCQAFINYGPHTNLKMFVEYGFILPGNPNDVVPLEIGDVVRVGCLTVSDERLLILRNSGLVENLGIHSSGVTWNVLACLHVLEMPERSLSNWRKVFDENFEGKKSDVVELLLRNKASEIARSISSLEGKADTSDIAKVALDLLRAHQLIVTNALD